MVWQRAANLVCSIFFFSRHEIKTNAQEKLPLVHVHNNQFYNSLAYGKLTIVLKFNSTFRH